MKKILLFSFLVSFAMASFAQKSKVENLPRFDNRKIHFVAVPPSREFEEINIQTI